MFISGKRKQTWIQCQTCGAIYQISNAVDVDELLVEAHCPGCDAEIGLNLGCDENDKYYYYNVNLDERYF